MRHVLPVAVLVLVAFALPRPTDAEDDGAMMGDDGMMGGAVDPDLDPFDEPIDPDDLAFFERRIRPLLDAHCYRCHSADAERVRGEFTLDTRDALRRGGPSGPGVVPGDADESLLIQAVRYDDAFLTMPPDGPLPAEAIADLERWVAMGAPDPRGVTEATVDTPAAAIDFEAAREFWSFRPPRRHPAPAVEDERWPWSDVDRFLLAAMEAQGLDPVRDADRAALLRRVTFDLTGLPPTPEALDAFLDDRAPGALERVVDDLLASPRFGERWGRHWLDVARYAESSGKESNLVYPHAWRYRDYVIDAFDADEPYDDFLRSQLAGDLLPADDADERAALLVATGYLALGTKSHNTRSRAQFTMDVVDEQIDTVTRGMLGLTVACARCHDHKFDPIPTRDYYAMAGVFLSTETCYGTVGSLGNRQPAPLLPLPEDADVSSGAPMPRLVRTGLERRLDRLEGEVERLAEDVRVNGRRDDRNAVRLLATRGQVETIRGILDRYDETGAPTAANRVAMGARDAERPRNARILVRGELDKAGDLVPRGVPEIVAADAAPMHGSTSGRLELAEWIASDANPLTARVWVNRVWLHLFGAPLVPTPDNFGRSGRPPAHPELLDTLAVEFMEQGWSTKRLVKSLVLTRAYQLSTTHDGRNQSIDPENVHRWRMTPKRLEGEAIRDAMLFVSGELDERRPAGSPIGLLEGSTRTLDRGLGALLDPPVRSVYLPIVRDRVPEALATFDFADPSFVTGDRAETTVPTQALYLLNDETVMRAARSMARRVLAHRGDDVERLTYAFRLALGREPTSAERNACRRFFAAFPEAQASGGSAEPERRAPPRRFARDRRAARDRGAGGNDDVRGAGWAAFCQSLLASAEFRYLN